MSTRSEALENLNVYVKYTGANYRSNRNYAEKLGTRQNVSSLSPFIRYRLISEEEVILQVLKENSYSAAEKFIQEVFWRTYWKGWMQLRPHLYDVYLDEVHYLRENLKVNNALEENYLAAINGQTGIACFDDWLTELVETGYLHNHVRMWFASIWTFTLNLPWQLGADFFMEHLLDGDQAVNTLSWRWVAGSQTKGKNYVARAENIHKYTKGAYFPAGQLNENPQPIVDNWETTAEELNSYVAPGELDTWGLVMAHEDLSPETWLALKEVPVLLVDGNSEALKGNRSIKVSEFIAGAQEDFLNRCKESSINAQIVTNPDSELVFNWAIEHQLKAVLWLDAGVGPWPSEAMKLTSLLKDHGIATQPVARDYDSRCWPLARKGFFKFKERIPTLIKSLGPQQELFHS